MIATIETTLGIIISVASVLGIFTGIINKLFNIKLKPIEKRIDTPDYRRPLHPLRLRRDLYIVCIYRAVLQAYRHGSPCAV